MENNQFQKTIESLVDNGHVILQVFTGEEDCLYFSVMDFQESFQSPTNSVEFNSVRGINVTDFMRTQGGNPNAVAMIAKFNDFINHSNVVRCEFSRNFRWMKWGSAAR